MSLWKALVAMADNHHDRSMREYQQEQNRKSNYKKCCANCIFFHSDGWCAKHDFYYSMKDGSYFEKCCKDFGPK